MRLSGKDTRGVVPIPVPATLVMPRPVLLGELRQLERTATRTGLCGVPNPLIDAGTPEVFMHAAAFVTGLMHGLSAQRSAQHADEVKFVVANARMLFDPAPETPVLVQSETDEALSRTAAAWSGKREQVRSCLASLVAAEAEHHSQLDELAQFGVRLIASLGDRWRSAHPEPDHLTGVLMPVVTVPDQARDFGAGALMRYLHNDANLGHDANLTRSDPAGQVTDTGAVR